MIRTELFDRLRPLKANGSFTPADVAAIDAIADELGMARLSAAPVSDVTVKIVLEVANHEALIQEWYKDSKGVGTWAIGVTNASGHNVDRYKDAPQPLRYCVQISVWLMRTTYLPDVRKAFGDRPLTEAQLAAALSFHYNTGAILVTDWVKLFLAGHTAEARTFLETHYLNDGTLKARRLAEAALFFDGTWSNDGTTLVYEVAKPSYAPKWSSAKHVDISADVAAVLADPA